MTALDQRAMCPKHGIAHGVCMDPIKAETPPEPEYADTSKTGPEPDRALLGTQAVMLSGKTPKHNHDTTVFCGTGCPFWDEAVGDGPFADLDPAGDMPEPRTERQDLHDALDERYPMIDDFRAFVGQGNGCNRLPDNEEMGGLERLAVEWNPEEKTCPSCGETEITYPHSCYPVSDINKVPDLTNRFDPYEALDMMIQILTDCMEHDRPRGGKPRESLGGYLIVDGDYATMSNQVYALRAYITGMEHG